MLEKEPLVLVASPNGAGGSVKIHQDVCIHWGKLTRKDDKLLLPLHGNRSGWIQVFHGTLMFAGETLQAGDGAGFYNEPDLEVGTPNGAEFLFFDLV